MMTSFASLLENNAVASSVVFLDCGIPSSLFYLIGIDLFYSCTNCKCALSSKCDLALLIIKMAHVKVR